MRKLNIHPINIVLGLMLPVLFMSGCKSEFLDRPPTDAIVDVNFYKTDDQLAAATSLLYSKVWFDYNENPAFSIGDIRAGTAFRGYNERANVEFATNDLTAENRRAWNALYTVVGQSN